MGQRKTTKMITDSTEPTHQLHQQYQHCTGLSIPFTMQLHYRLEHWMVQGGTAADMELVVRYLKRRIRQGKRPMESLLPRNLFSDYSNFLEDLSMARADSRPKPDPAREAVLAATGRTIPVQPAKPVADILAGCAALAEFRAWRERSGL